MGGAERMVLSLAKSLDARLFRVSVACLNGGGTLLEQVRKHGFVGYSLSDKHSFHFLITLLRIMQEEKVDLVQTHGARAEFIGTLIGRLAGVPFIVSTLHDLYGFSNRGKYVFSRLTDPWITHYVSVTPMGRVLAMQKFKISQQRIDVIENGIDVGPLKNDQEVAKLRTHLSIAADDCLILTVANLRPVKGHIHILQAIKMMTVEEREGLVFCFVGQDQSNGRLQQVVREWELSKTVKFAGFQKDIFPYLHAADLFLLSSESEGMPMAVLEAMSVSCPVIATNVGGIVKMIENEQTGLLIPPCSATAIRKAVLKLSSDVGLRRKLALNALVQVQRRFSVERMAQKYQNLYCRCQAEREPEYLSCVAEKC